MSLMTVYHLLKIQPSSLGVKLLIRILAVSSLFALLATLLELAVDYNHDMDDVDHTLDEIRTTRLPVLANSLWNFDDVQISLTLSTLIQLPSISRAEMSAGSEHFAAGTLRHDSSAKAVDFELNSPKNHEQHLGILRIYISYGQIYNRLLHRAVVILITQTLKTFIVSIAILLLIKRMVTRPLGVLAQFARGLTLERLDHELHLPERDPNNNDELDDVAANLNHMRTTLQAGLAARQRAEQILAQEKERLDITLRAITDAVITVDTIGRISAMNPSAVMLTDWPEHSALGQPVNVIVTLLPAPGVGSGTAAPDVMELLGNKPPGFRRARIISRTGAFAIIDTNSAALVDDTGEKQGHVIILRDVSSEHEMEQRLHHQARHDPLTGLPNRMSLAERFPQTLLRATARQHKVAVLFIDLDRFKNINDTLGHAVGDLLLESVAARLRQVVEQRELIFRHGGDEFIILLANLDSEQELLRQLSMLIDLISRPYDIAGYELAVTASIGISRFPEDGESMENLLKQADAALYEAKARGRNTYAFFDAHMAEKSRERFSMEGQLRQAITRQELELYYQPQIDLTDGRIIGCEALMRWHHPEKGLVSPVNFIPIAEESGLIVPMGTWAMHEACRQAKAWQEQGLPNLVMAVNLSAVQFNHPALISTVAQVLENTGLPPECLELEVTESVIMNSDYDTVERLHQLKKMGLKLAIDDFGTGYSSLLYLKRFPIDKLKIDQNFVRDIVSDPNDAVIALAIINLAHSLKLRVIAEGVETPEHVHFLSANHCNEAQGFHFSRPIPATEFIELLRVGNTGASLD